MVVGASGPRERGVGLAAAGAERQTLEKWFCLPQRRHVCPLAGQVDAHVECDEEPQLPQVWRAAAP